MYLWTLLGRDPQAPPILSGVSRDMAGAMRAAEPMLLDGRAFIAVIEEARIRIAVAGLEERYVPTGRTWHGRRTNSGGVHWTARLRPDNPAAIYRVPADLRDGVPAAAEPEPGPGSGPGSGPGGQPDGSPPSAHAPR